MPVSLLNAFDPFSHASAARRDRTRAAEAAPFVVASALEQADDRAQPRPRRAAPVRREAENFADPFAFGLGDEDEAEAALLLPEDALDGQALCALLKTAAF